MPAEVHASYRGRNTRSALSDFNLNHGPDDVARPPRRQRSGRALGESACHDWSIEENSIELAASGIQADFSSVYGAPEALERRIATPGRARHRGVSVRGRRSLATLLRCKASDLTGLNPLLEAMPGLNSPRT